MKRTKGGLLPWWVRKRLQEHSEPDQKGIPDVEQKPVKAKKETPNILEVGNFGSLVFRMPHQHTLLGACPCHVWAAHAEG